MKKAFMYFSQAAKQNDPRGLYYVATFYENGEGGVSQNLRISMQFYYQAALRNDTEATEFIATLCRSQLRKEFKKIALIHLADQWPNSHNYLSADCQIAIIEFLQIMKDKTLKELVEQLIRWLIILWPSTHYQNINPKST